MNLNKKENIEFIPDVFDEDDDYIPLLEQDFLNEDEIPDIIPILPLRNTVLFPGVVIPISVGRPKSLKLVHEAYKNDTLIGTLTQKDPKIENPKRSDLYKTGIIAYIAKILQMPDDSTMVIIQGKNRFNVEKFTTSNPYFKAKVNTLPDEKPENINQEFEAVIASLKDLSLKVIELSGTMPAEASFTIKNIESPFFLINFISSNIDIAIKEKQELLKIDNIEKRAEKLLKYLAVEVKKLEIKDDIRSKTKVELDQQQREYFLNEQIKTIQNELGQNSTDQEIEEMKIRALKKKWNEDVKKAFDKEIKKLERINPASPDYSIHLNYLQTLLDLPWNEYTKDNLDLTNAHKVLDEDHFGLEKIKERILEHLAVLKLKGDLKSPILCLYGPPGVGKTSLGKSIARALKRKYARISLGGLHDEAEIRGHRKTYIGAMPGRIVQNLKKTKASNPVFILDEIDKIGTDFRGDPSYALLEVLDPEQNSTFYDNYLELEYDLSKVMFIATANSLNTINPALLDRMETIHVSGYIVEEKIQIAQIHLLPSLLKNHGIKKSQLKIPDKTLEFIITHYTKESGVRELNKTLATLTRKIAKKIGFDQKYNVTLTEVDIQDLLGAKKYLSDKYQGNEYAGVVTGLAWTAAGGVILFVEVALSQGKGNLTITGNVGDVMKESVMLALQVVKSNSQYWNIDNEIFDKWNIHLHLPEGAIPKDGPSAGITIVTAMVSAYTQRKIKEKTAMTGEITLRGKVLPVGGIKEKILAAKRANIKEVILSKDNEKDINEIKEIYRKGLTFHFVDSINEVLDIALLNQKVQNPINFSG